MRPKVVAECTLKESAAINQILGRKWHALTREEQAKYYEAVGWSNIFGHISWWNIFVQARKERQLHMQMYPGWSARDNYAQSKEVDFITSAKKYHAANILFSFRTVVATVNALCFLFYIFQVW